LYYFSALVANSSGGCGGKGHCGAQQIIWAALPDAETYKSKKNLDYHKSDLESSSRGVNLTNTHNKASQMHLDGF
jgi:hypothetical protein